MAENFTIYFKSTISDSIDVTADNWDDALEKATEEFEAPRINAGNEFDIDGDWEPFEISTRNESKPIVNHTIQKTEDQ